MPKSTRLLIQDTAGHTTNGMGMSSCVASALSDFYLNGKLPKNEQHCKGDNDIFQAPTPNTQSLGKLRIALKDATLSEKLLKASQEWAKLRARRS